MTKSLYIAEKPSVAQEFAKALKENMGRRDGYVESENFVVTWCVGHLVTMSYPEKYDMKFKRWSLETLPFLPENFDLAHLHGFQCILMTLRCYASAACGINTDRHFRKGGLDQKSIGDHTDVCAKSHKSNASDSLVFIKCNQFAHQIC